MRNRGFTLVEVMVALAVVAVALPALMFTLSQQVDNTAYLRDKSIAHMVASNKLAELRLLARARQDLLKGKDSGVEEMAGRDWYWWINSTETEVDQFYRIDLDIRLVEETEARPLYSTVAFMSSDLQSVPGGANPGSVNPGGGGPDDPGEAGGDDDAT